LFGQDDGDAGADARVVSLADLEALDVGDQVQRPGAARRLAWGARGALRGRFGARSARGGGGGGGGGADQGRAEDGSAVHPAVSLSRALLRTRSGVAARSFCV